MSLSDFTDNTVDAIRNAGSYVSNFVNPVIRLGVTGLANSGKTVFITSLIHNLIHGGRLPFFDAVAEGRIMRAYLEPQPDDEVPRFDYESHLAKLTGEIPVWPESTKRISQLRITLEYEPDGFLKRTFRSNKIRIDIVDYPGEWLLDLPLLNLTFDEWSAKTIGMAREPARVEISRAWTAFLQELDANAPQDEHIAKQCADLFKAYLKKCRTEEHALSTVPPGRFLMPGELEGSPALTFSPLILPSSGSKAPESLWAMMDRRFESYKSHVVKPFFRTHFINLDRQIVLVDALAALNAGPAAVNDLEQALADILSCFRPGGNSWLSSIWRRRIDRILFAATKADHIHHCSHDRLETIMNLLTRQARERAEYSGAAIKSVAIAAVRATREAEAVQDGETLPCIMGIPLSGERLGQQAFDQDKEIAIFPGDLPDDPAVALQSGHAALNAGQDDLRFIRFRPPPMENADGTVFRALPHIRLDRALNYLLGDRLT